MSKKKAYVIGNKVRTSLSPTIFKYWFDKYKIDAEYSYREIKENNFEKEILSLKNEEGLVGLNITIPYKERITDYLNTSFGRDLELNLAKENLPINCVTVDSSSQSSSPLWNGTNTDWVGFINSYVDFEKIRGKNRNGSAFVIGYGGAAKAIIFVLRSMGFEKIKVFNRTFDKFKEAQNMKRQNASTKFGKCTIKEHKLEDLFEHIDNNKNKEDNLSLIVNTTPINILGDTKEWGIGPRTWGFDIVYRPRTGTGFLKHFNPKNRIEGIQMLAHQAAPCFERWFGLNPTVDKNLFNVLYKKMKET